MKTLDKVFSVSLFLATSLVAGRASAGGIGASGADTYAESQQTWDWDAQQYTDYGAYSYDAYYYDPYGWGADLADTGSAGLAIATVFGAQFGCGGTTLAGVYAVDPFCGY